MPLPTKEDLEAAKLYHRIMEEIVTRVDAHNWAVNGLMALTPSMVHEFCFLQFRYICELIATGCLVAHGDIKETKTKNFQKGAPHEIFRKLGELNASFYPYPTEVRPRDGFTEFYLVNEGEKDFLTKRELKTLWDQAGDVLHRSGLKKILTPRIVDKDYPELGNWARKIVGLLRVHTIARISGVPLLCAINDRPFPSGSRVNVSFAGSR